jgi:hypothetical protein
MSETIQLWLVYAVVGTAMLSLLRSFGVLGLLTGRPAPSHGSCGGCPHCRDIQRAMEAAEEAAPAAAPPSPS